MKEKQLSDDQKWMLQAKTGKEAFSKIIQKHQGPLANFFLKLGAHREDAEDMVQETFVRLYRSLNNYEPKAKFTTFFYTLARHVWVDHYRKQGRQVTINNEVELNLLKDQKDFTEDIDRQLDIQDYLNRLGKKHREALVMYYFMKFKYTEIADILNTPVGTIKSRVHEGLKKLEEMISNFRFAQ